MKKKKAFKYTEKTIFEVDAEELQFKIGELYDKGYDIMDDAEPSPDTSIEVVLKKGATAYMEEPSYSDYMQDMCNKDIIPEGNWYIKFDF